MENIKKETIRRFKITKDKYCKDPFFYLGLVAVILFGMVSFLPPSAARVPSPILTKDIQKNGEDTFLFSGLNVKESPDLSIIQKNSLAAVSPPITVTPQVLGALVGGQDYQWQNKEATEYIIQPGDNLWSIAEKFNISLDTILWANDLTESSTLQPGKELLILPVSGALHLVRPNDTLSEIAMWYEADISQIMWFNEIASAGEIFAGDLLIIPNGIKPKTLLPGRLAPVGSSYFVYPVASPHRITQGLHYYNAVDFSNGVCGEQVYAAAGGIVQLTGYSSLGGKFVRILHSNGVVTYYGHFSSIIVSPGQKVLQGQIIGYTGRTGVATGCHVHFEVRGAQNPFVK